MERMIRDIRSLLADPALRERLATNCVEYVRRNHGEEVIARQYMELFQSLTSNGRGSIPNAMPHD